MALLKRLLGVTKRFRDPVCGMELPAGRARDFAVHKDVTYQFCSTACKEQFEREPERYLAGAKAGSKEEHDEA